MTSLSVDVMVQRDGFFMRAAFEAGAGRTVGLLGPNGSGKSTTVDVISGILAVSEGYISAGDEVWDRPATGVFVSPQRRSVGVMFQHLALFPALSVLENVAYGARARKRPSPKEHAMAVLEQLDAAHLQARPTRSLSGGEAQRVALARALVSKPQVLMLDEPLSALDVRARGAARRTLKEVLAAFQGVKIIVTHDPLEAMTLADDIIVMEQGAITQQGEPGEIRSHPRSAYAAAFAGTNLLSGTLTTEGSQTILETEHGRLQVVSEQIPDGEPVLASIHPATITLSLGHSATSARNQIRGRITAIDDTGSRVRVALDGSPPLVAEVTRDAAATMGLRPGLELWAAVKATRIEVYPDG
jgi:molybdate transport system ATP-binding protein